MLHRLPTLPGLPLLGFHPKRFPLMNQHTGTEVHLFILLKNRPGCGSLHLLQKNPFRAPLIYFRCGLQPMPAEEPIRVLLTDRTACICCGELTFPGPPFELLIKPLRLTAVVTIAI